MRKVAVPAPPQASFETAESKTAAQRREAGNENVTNAAASQRIAPLDAAFLGRVYRVCLSFGALLTLCLAVLSRNAALPLSCFAGLLTGVLVIKTQEMFVRRVVRPKSWPAYDGADKKLPVWLIVPGKYVLIIAAIILMRRAGLLNFVAFAAGCTLVQLIVLTMALGRLMGSRGRSLNEIYVQPHKTKNSPHA